MLVSRLPSQPVQALPALQLCRAACVTGHAQTRLELATGLLVCRLTFGGSREKLLRWVSLVFTFWTNCCHGLKLGGERGIFCGHLATVSICRWQAIPIVSSTCVERMLRDLVLSQNTRGFKRVVSEQTHDRQIAQPWRVDRGLSEPE